MLAGVPGGHMAVGKRALELQAFARDDKRLSREHIAQRANRRQGERREVGKRLVAYLPALAIGAAEQVAPRLRRTRLRPVLARNLSHMHRAIAAGHVVMPHAHLVVKYTLGRIRGEPISFSSSSIGRISRRLGGKSGLETVAFALPEPWMRFVTLVGVAVHARTSIAVEMLGHLD